MTQLQIKAIIANNWYTIRQCFWQYNPGDSSIAHKTGVYCTFYETYVLNTRWSSHE